MTTQNKHTPGPYTHTNFSVYAGDKLIADCHHALTANESAANACLFAAAPELLEACKAVLVFKLLSEPKANQINLDTLQNICAAACLKATDENINNL